ncbi:NADH-quinone oxidoreductase subunit J [uncultured Acetobacteroides sp.]|jgi:NADH-quinone oxidoreductase subunit J|uniref:NADH-quinone oxidoreductase subunit J family protein n=1 Tax=uncultured Acetobacteroides sp. TaxID=1760811 RepID=UPI0029F4D1AA|nr:NADH-quinone oxidoreductase subunit J [uncultured Acetobacteroides sp.]
MSLIFYILATLAVISALGVVFVKNPINSVLLLICTFLTIAGQYILLNAQFLAVVHVIVYMGAIMVLFIFVIMLLNLNKEKESFQKLMVKVAALLTSGLLLLVLLAAAAKVSLAAPNAAPSADLGLVRNLGLVLFRDYLFPFETASVLFLAAMVGAVVLGKREPKKA